MMLYNPLKFSSLKRPTKVTHFNAEADVFAGQPKRSGQTYRIDLGKTED